MINTFFTFDKDTFDKVDNLDIGLYELQTVGSFIGFKIGINIAAFHSLAVDYLN